MARIEILAPVGSEEMLRAAVFSGADAVYLGFSGFNARTGAGNFDADSLQEAVRFCHARGVAVHVALNTTVYGTELPALEQAIRAVAASGADAVICQDLAVATLIGKIAPQLPRHGSTQMSVHTLQGALELKELGFTRVVLARELSLPEVEHITKHCGIETECFVHGALCMCVSGQCYMSAFLGGRSGNRGSCAGPCRLPFAADGSGAAHLSLKDLCAVGSLPALDEAGVASVKIEGRLRGPEYVAAAVNACHKSLAGEAFDKQQPQDVFSRSGFTNGYIEGKISGAMFGVRTPEDTAASKAAMPAIRELLNRILRDTVDTWARVHTLGGLADALSGLCDTLLVYGSGNDEDGAGNGKADIWSRFPIDAECLFRLMQRVIPALKDNGMADTPLPWPLMQAMLLELVRAERVPFEADPLTGLQVLGMLETRLLRFSRVFLVDVTDDRLPGAPIRSPLLPDSLRALLGLPDTRNREQLAAYTFHRLIAGADEVWLYWQEGVETSGLFDGKKQRSRLVEELIWQEEQARGQRLKPGREPLRTAALDVRPPVRVRKVVPKTPAIREQIAASLKHPLSATRLDAYLTCPLRYYYERLCAIAPIDEVNEDDDPAAVGSPARHRRPPDPPPARYVLRDFYAPAVGKTVRRDAQSGDPELPFLDEKALRALFRTALDASGLEAALPPESAAMLSVTGPERLGMFLRAQPEQTEVLSLEEEYDAEIRVGGRIRRLTGNLDRVDWREQEDPEGAIDEGAVILDYKTGRIKALRPDIWADDAFWDALDPEKAAEAASEPDPEHDFLPIMAQRIPTVQLLYYCYLYGQATGKPVLDAAFVALGEDGGERPLFGKGMTIEERERALSLIPRLIGFILLHMELCPEFRPREGAHCRWCSWRNVCIISSQQ